MIKTYAMQSVALYGRLLARAIFTGHNPELQKRKDSYQFLTGASGFSKSPLTSCKTGLKNWTFGDDAYFIAKDKHADVIGVADGVGGWRNYGVDPSAFSRTLMHTCQRMVQEGRFSPQAPATIIADSYREVLEQKTPLIGSSTACIVALHREEQTIYTANIGDSGFLVIRDDEVVHRSIEQVHYFNTPFQLSVAPPSQQGLVLSDSPDIADTTTFKVQEGDIVLVGTDGLFDNMHEDIILDYLCKIKNEKENIQKTATRIAEDALHLSLDEEHLSPFSQAAREAGILNMQGGKPDDITVILARVTCLEGC